VFFGVPTMYVRLLEAAQRAPDRARAIGRAARLFVSGSAPLSADIHRVFHEAFGHDILERYGMTETLITVSNPVVGERRAGSIGTPLPRTEVRVVDEAGADAPDNTIGELWVRGPQLFRGYWAEDAATAAAHTDGWFRTGDAAVRAPDGYLTLVGRLRELIIAGGFNIAPREVEDALRRVAGIEDAAVVGRPDRARGEIVVAFVVANAPFDEIELREQLRADLASFKVPKHIVRVDALPRTALGKIQKHLLPALADA
jgi:malonyl-CoA/methylmalonyl-CoA synthetase